MSLAARPATNHPQQVARSGARDEIDDRATTAEVFEPLNALYGPFTIDVAAAAHNTKCARFYDRSSDGLAQSWAGESVWLNPPYSSIEPWLVKAWAETEALRVVALLPANRTEQGWWQRLVEPYRDREGSPLRSTFLAGRLRFINAGKSSVGANERPPFGCVVLVWTPVPGFAGPDVATLFGAAS